MRRRTAAALLGILAAAACGAPTCSRGACDRAAVGALAEELADLDTRAQEATLRARLPDLCALPPGLRRGFDDREGRSQPLLSREALAELNAEFAKLCPDFDRISAETGALASRERVLRIYDACDLARLGVVDRDDMLRNQYGLRFWATYQWLVEQGIEPEVVGALAPGLRAMSRRSLVRIEDAEPLDLPTVDAPLTARPVGVRVELSTSAAVVDSRTIATIADGGIVEGVEEHRLFGLDEHLAEEIERQRERAAGDLAVTPEPVRIAADRRVRFAALADVIFTAARRGVRDFALEVEIDAYDRVALPFELPPPSTGAAALWLAVADDGALELRAPERRVFEGAADLGRWVAERCADGPSSAPAVVEPAWDVEVGAITPLLVALRGEACGDASGPGCCFPRVAFATPRE